MSWRTTRNVGMVVPIAIAIAIGVFLGVASHELAWSDTSTIVVGGALVAVLGMLGAPIVILSLGEPRTDVGPESKGESEVPKVESRSGAAPRETREADEGVLYAPGEGRARNYERLALADIADMAIMNASRETTELILAGTSRRTMGGGDGTPPLALVVPASGASGRQKEFVAASVSRRTGRISVQDASEPAWVSK